MITKIIIRGFILYQIEITFSINNIIKSKNHNTNIRELIVDNMPKKLLFHWYMKVRITQHAKATAIIRGTIFELL